jgi:hypothetical protein
VFAGGSPTPINAIPTTGSATYTGDAAGFASIPTPAGDAHTNGTMNMAFQGAASVGINFGTQAVTTNFTGMKAVSMDSIATQSNLPDLTGTGTLTGGKYTTTLTGTATGLTAGPTALTGSANGTLFGPAAQETAGTFSASNGVTSCAAAPCTGVSIIGAFGAKK